MSSVIAFFVLAVVARRWWLRRGGEDAVPVPSIAVLPFVNMSGNVDNEYFSDGLTEEILNSLAKIRTT